MGDITLNGRKPNRVVVSGDRGNDEVSAEEFIELNLLQVDSTGDITWTDRKPGRVVVSGDMGNESNNKVLRADQGVDSYRQWGRNKGIGGNDKKKEEEEEREERLKKEKREKRRKEKEKKRNDERKRMLDEKRFTPCFCAQIKPYRTIKMADDDVDWRDMRTYGTEEYARKRGRGGDTDLKARSTDADQERTGD